MAWAGPASSWLTFWCAAEARIQTRVFFNYNFGPPEGTEGWGWVFRNPRPCPPQKWIPRTPLPQGGYPQSFKKTLIRTSFRQQLQHSISLQEVLRGPRATIARAVTPVAGQAPSSAPEPWGGSIKIAHQLFQQSAA